MTMLGRRILILLPALALIGWLLIEQFPVWNAPPTPARRYPDFVALPGGCEAAYALARYDATADPSAATAIDAQRAASIAEETLALHLPGAEVVLSAPPQLMRAAVAESHVWIGLFALGGENAALARAALIAVGAQSGEPLALIMLNGLSADSADCGGFAPAPSGLRAQLRPYLPLMALVSYLGIVAAASVVLPRLRRRREL